VQNAKKKLKEKIDEFKQRCSGDVLRHRHLFPSLGLHRQALRALLLRLGELHSTML
jgi:hypothetical protein